MILKARKFLIFIIIAAVIHVTCLIYEYYFQLDYDVIEPNIQTFPSKYQLHKLKSKKVVWLSDLLVCNKNVTEDLHKATTVREVQRNALMCPLIAPDLGPVEKDASIMNLRGIDEMSLRISAGGIHVPDCIAQQQVAIVLAVHDDMWKNIASFMFYIHPFLMKQQLEYQIFVVRKSTPGGIFERGKLFNIGFVEAQTYRNGGWDCFIFHEANLLPLDTRNLYRCSRRPKRLIADFRKPYRFGGAVAISPQHFVQVDGFSNRVGSKDDDYINMYRRLMAANLSVESNFNQIGSYTMFNIASNDSIKIVTDLFHSSQCVKEGSTRHIIRTRPHKILKWNQTHGLSNFKDGLSTLFYSSSTLELEQFYSLIKVQDNENDEPQSTLIKRGKNKQIVNTKRY